MTDIMTWEELNEKRYPKEDFLLDPYIPREGIVLLWGATSTGKSPLGWSMASAIGRGTSFFGLPTREGRVLYVENDTPEQVVAGRVRKLPPAPNVWWMFTQPLSLPGIDPEDKRSLLRANDEVAPDVVFLNTLRKLHDMDDKDSVTPKVVYTFFRKLFPKSALVFVHHVRKQSTDPRALDRSKESFSGSNHWLDDAQVGIHLESYDSSRENLRLYHRKSQASELLRPLPLKLESDGSTLHSPLFDELFFTYELMNTWEREKNELDATVAMKFGISPSTAKKRRLAIESGRFPGSREFLGRATQEVEEA